MEALPHALQQGKGGAVGEPRARRSCITPCHNCHSGIEDIIGFYDLGMHTKFISDILMETMEIPEELKGSPGE